jgi:two-component system, OmpR family, sensor histidine kinase KdpD
LLEEEKLLKSEDKLELTRGICDEATRMANLIQNILDMAYLDAGVIQLNKQWYPLEEIIGTVLTRLQKRLDGRPVSVNIPSGCPMIQADSGMIEQVLANLLENAARYTPEHSSIEISATLSPFAAEISVADHGPGIPKGLEKQLFEKFFRVKNEAAQSGVGLGLAICRAIVEVHGGSIQTRNRGTGGAIFSFVLPLDEAPPSLEPEEYLEAQA